MLATGVFDLAGPAAPSGLHVTTEATRVSLAWNAVAGAASLRRLRQPAHRRRLGEGERRAAQRHDFTTPASATRGPHYFVSGARRGGQQSAPSNEVPALPHLAIGWANLQWPPTMTHTISAVERTDDVYGQVWIDGVTNQPGADAGPRAQLGFGPDGSDPAGNALDLGRRGVQHRCRQQRRVRGVAAARRRRHVRLRVPLLDDGWPRLGLCRPRRDRQRLQPGAGRQPDRRGERRHDRPAAPTGLHVVSASPAGIELAWDAVAGDPTLYGYEVLRSSIRRPVRGRSLDVTDTAYTDPTVSRARPTTTSCARSTPRSTARGRRRGLGHGRAAHGDARVHVTVPATTDGTGRSVYIAGFLDRLDGGLPQWNPGGVVLTRVDATHWTITLTGREATRSSTSTRSATGTTSRRTPCGEIANRQLTLSYGASGTQAVNDTAQNWRNVAPCGN